MFQVDPDYNIVISLLKIGGCVIAFYIWGMISKGWGNKNQ
mgnify:CR=1 FL=1|tara:strand:+ start:1996 stop:2115 length:120 start_codon:yes stop_codon:yes gene_type:complete